MNYRHHFHAGNYADVFKHVLLLQLIRAMQAKEKGFLYLDTHAGRGSYDLTAPSVLPDGRERAPEHPAGIGRCWGASNPSEPFADYLAVVQRFNERRGAAIGQLDYYPGSPWIARLAARPQDRLALCELQHDDAELLDFDFAREQRVTVHEMDGYIALKAKLPPPEKRALVLIDPPFESQLEFVAIRDGLAEALRRFPSGVFAIWYPITERTRAGEFQQRLLEMRLPPTLVVELQVAGEASQVHMKGCGLLVINPPWKIDAAIRPLLPEFVSRLQVDRGAFARIDWLVPER